MYNIFNFALTQKSNFLLKLLIVISQEMLTGNHDKQKTPQLQNYLSEYTWPKVIPMFQRQSVIDATKLSQLRTLSFHEQAITQGKA